MNNIDVFLNQKFSELETNSKKMFPLLKFSYAKDITWDFPVKDGIAQLRWQIETEGLPTFLLTRIESIFAEVTHLE